MPREENDQRCDGVMRPNITHSYRYRPKVDYYPITADPEVFYSSNATLLFIYLFISSFKEYHCIVESIDGCI